ncbi:hypothetical protein J1N35_044501 [Gossypium stocksii]|uniref:Uncharacterized protein n=1 Tax=Gossypium stocksii TaxID=47602 RepID=A0A9D3U9B1_9ROSI|nr:hypothetical protein J1N35_044501 [Gossypium stocksii]
MELLAESISNISKGNCDSGNSASNVEQKEGRQKARYDWFHLGDRNTKFYHSRMIKRRNFNHIIALRIDNWEWCSDQDILKNKAVEFFEKLYGEVFPCLGINPSFSFPRLFSAETFLEAEITNEEIEKVLFDMAPLKAPGSDVYHAHFSKVSGTSLVVMCASGLKMYFLEGQSIRS